jgi:insulysin
LAVPGSTLNRFSTGNLETLKVPNLMEELQSFYKSNYSSNLMNLVLVGRADLDSLQEFAVSNFSEVENRDLPYKDFSGHVVFD